MHKPTKSFAQRTVKLLIKDIIRMLKLHLRLSQQQSNAHLSTTISKSYTSEMSNLGGCYFRILRVGVWGRSHFVMPPIELPQPFVWLKCQFSFFREKWGQTLPWVHPQLLSLHTLCKQETLVPQWLLWILRRKASHKWGEPLRICRAEVSQQQSDSCFSELV